jgi:tyrosine aminotransferase
MALETVVNLALDSSSGHAAGYIDACGTAEARAAIATYHSYPEHAISPENVVVASGCSGALELVLTSLLDVGTYLLVPQPGFPLYQVITESHGASVIQYRLNPNRHWECDLDHLEEIMMTHREKKPNIRGIVINNPSNPTGAVFRRDHLFQIIDFCNRYHLPIVADEVYGDITFGVNNVFHPMAQLAAQCGRQVPVITTSGLAKQFLLPGTCALPVAFLGILSLL